uniref:DNA-directed RNA polymerase III subunit RPC9 n=1 Tax=Ixodes ricinus TaxID=34613 RepID=A0A090XDJ7_IXORI
MKIIKESSVLSEQLRSAQTTQGAAERQDQSPDKHAKHVQNLATVSYETVTYLEQTACARQSEEKRTKVPRKRSARSRFTTDPRWKSCKLINHRPTTFVEIQLLIEENEERLSEDDMQTILDIVERTLPPAQDEPENAENAEDGEMECE